MNYICNAQNWVLPMPDGNIKLATIFPEQILPTFSTTFDY